MAPFVESRDEMDAYIQRFESYATSSNWDRSLWPLYLSALLTGRALSVYSKLPPNLANDFSSLKEALFIQFNMTENGYRAKFKEAKPKADEGPLQLLNRIKSYLSRWSELSSFSQDYQGLTDLMVVDQFLTCCPKDLAVHLRETGLSGLNNIASRADKFLQARGSNLCTKRENLNSSVASCSNKEILSYNTQRQHTKICGLCNKVGHVSIACYSAQN